MPTAGPKQQHQRRQRLKPVLDLLHGIRVDLADHTKLSISSGPRLQTLNSSFASSFPAKNKEEFKAGRSCCYCWPLMLTSTRKGTMTWTCP